MPFPARQTLTRRALVILIAVFCLHCSSGGGASGAGSTGNGAAPDTGTETASTTTAATTLNSVQGSTTDIIQNAGASVTALLRAEHATRHLAGSAPGRITDSFEFDETVACPDGGDYALTGSSTYEFDEDSFDLSMTGDLAMSITACADEFDVEASDGACSLAGTLNGSFAADFTYDYTDATQSDDLELNLATDAAMTLAVNDETHTLEFALSYSASCVADDCGDEELSGTYTIDGEEFDASEEVDTTAFTMEELGCTPTDEDTDTDSGDDGSSENSADTLLANVRNWAYQLQNMDVDEIGASLFDIVIVDYSADGSDEEAFSADQVTTMKGSGDAQKLVIAYMSIGEAEDYRYYFDPSASYMDSENLNFPGNFKVRYFEPEWQAIIDTYVDRLLAAGFDGVYLDIIDAYEFFGPGGDSGLDRASAADDMADFVLHIAEYARTDDADFLVFPQNGSGIIGDSSKSEEYLAAINGIGAEDTFYFGDADENNPLDPQETAIAALDQYAAAGKVVLSIDYVTEQDLIDDYYQRASDKGYIPYATVRALDALTVPSGHEP